MNNISNKLNDLMNFYSLSANDLATKLNLPDAFQIYKWRKNIQSINLSSAIKLADFFECSLDYLMGRSDDFSKKDFKLCPKFSEQLKKVLKNLNISQTTIVKNKIAYTKTLNGWINKNVDPHMTNLIRLADYLDVSLDYLVGREK